MTSLDLNNRIDVPVKEEIDGSEQLAAVFEDGLYVVTIDAIKEHIEGDITWDEVQNKPVVFPPSPHTHAPADIIGLGTAALSNAGDFATAAQGALADTALQPAALNGYVPNAREINAGAGLTGGGALDANRTISLNNDTITSLGLADTAVQPQELGLLAAKNKASVADIDATGVPGANNVLYGDGSWRTPAGGGDLFSANNLSDLTNVSDARDNLGLGSLAVKNTVNNVDWSGAVLSIENGGTGAGTAATARTNLGLGTAATQDFGAFATAAQGALAQSAVQPDDLGALAIKDKVAVSDITAAGIAGEDTFLRGDGTWAAAGGGGGGDLLAANNLSDLDNIVTARGNLGLGNVNNTSDANKPVSAAQQTALNLKANLAGPTFTGVPAAPTAAAGTNTTQIATTAFVTAAVPIKATEGAIRNATAGAFYIASDTIYAANGAVALVDAANISFAMVDGINFTLTLGGNRILSPVTADRIIGKSGIFIIKQDAAGSRTLSYSANMVFQGGAPTLSTAANAIDIIAYYVESLNIIRCSFIKGS